MAKIPPLVEGPRKGGRNPMRENFIRPNPPPAFRAKQITQEAYLAGLEDGRAATIERCAQVALEWLRENGYELKDLELVAAIRALKDKP